MKWLKTRWKICWMKSTNILTIDHKIINEWFIIVTFYRFFFSLLLSLINPACIFWKILIAFIFLIFLKIILFQISKTDIKMISLNSKLLCRSLDNQNQFYLQYFTCFYLFIYFKWFYQYFFFQNLDCYDIIWTKCSREQENKLQWFVQHRISLYLKDLLKSFPFYFSLSFSPSI